MKSVTSIVILILTGTILATSWEAVAQLSATLPVSKGVYQFPYGENTQVTITRDHTNHGTNGPRNRLDIMGQNGITIVAAADGWLEYIDDSAVLACPNSCDNYSGPAGASNCCPRNNPACNGACRNNHIWMRHPNGEWTKYSHLQTDTVPAALNVGDFIPAGTTLGAEGDVGFANGAHLHFEVGFPLILDFSLPPEDVNYDPLGMDLDPSQPGVQCTFCSMPSDGEPSTPSYDRKNRVPVFCSVGIAQAGETITTTSCDGLCPGSDSLVLDDRVVADDTAEYFQRSVNIDALNMDVLNGGGSALRAGNRIRLLPGFSTAANGYFSASIGNCDSPGT